MFRHVTLHHNCTENPAGHICKLPDKITVVDVLGYVMCVCLYVYSTALTHCGEVSYFDSSTEFNVKNLYSALCYDLRGLEL